MQLFSKALKIKQTKKNRSNYPAERLNSVPYTFQL